MIPNCSIYGPIMPIDEMEDLWKCNGAGRTQSGKHGMFDEIPWNLLKMCTTISKFSETTPSGLSVILVQVEDHRCDASPDMTCSGKHGIFRGTFSKVLKLIPYRSKRSGYTYV